MSEEDKVRQIRARIESFNARKEKENAGETITRVAKEAGIISRFLGQIAKIGVWFWIWFLNPLRKVAWSWIKFLFLWYISIWNKFCIVTEKKTGVKRLSYFRGFGTIVATVAFFMFVMPFTQLVFDTVMFVFPPTSEHYERVYLFGSTDNSFADDNWSVTGCQIDADAKEFRCDDEHTLYYRIESTWFSNIYTMLVHHNFFLPEVVGAPVAPGWNECKVNAVGLRVKFFVRNLNWYVNLLDTDCRPVVINNLQAS